MKNFILNLYNNEHFVLWLVIILVVLVALFVIVLFLGKKDKKLQETRKLEKIDVPDTFKETSSEVKVEVPPVENINQENVVQTDVPVAEEVPREDNINMEMEDNVAPENNGDVATPMEVVEPLEEMPTESPVEVPIENNQEVVSEPLFNEEATVVLPVVDDNTNLEVLNDETVELNTNDINNEATVTVMEPEKDAPVIEETQNDNEVEIQDINFTEINDSLEKELSELESLKNQFNDIELPDNEFDLPKLEEKEKEEEKVEEKEEHTFQPSPQIFSSVFVDKEEEDFELPTLKKENEEEEKEEVEKKEEENPEFNTSTFRFDEINGETYNLNDK